MGAKYTYSINHSFHLHRIILPIFLHNDISHLFSNLLPLAMVGFSREALLGKAEYFGLLLFGGITGYLMSGIFRPSDLAVGASTSVFAVLGSLCVIFWV